MSAAPIPKGVLILSNDLLTPFAKTSDYLADAFERRNIPAYVRDNADARLLALLFDGELAAKRPQAQEAVGDAQRELIAHAAIDTVVSLDLNWFVSPGLLVDDPQIRSIHSLWFDDFRSWCTSSYNTTFPVEGDVFQAHIQHPKVTHHFYGDSQAQEARLLGVARQRLTRLAAPRHLLREEAPCTRRDRLAFIGNPGFRGKPHAGALKLLETGAELDDLRAFCRDAIIQYPDEQAVKWMQEEPTVKNLLAVAAEAPPPLPLPAGAADRADGGRPLSAGPRVHQRARRGARRGAADQAGQPL